MALPPPAGSASQAGFPEINEGLAEGRDALLLFADAEGALAALVCDPGNPGCRYPDLTAVRSFVTVDELLHLVGRIPSSRERDRGEASALYPTLLELAELFDILIDQHSLVYGDAVALAESMAPGWRAMGGGFDLTSPSAAGAVLQKQVAVNLAALPALLDSLSHLSADARRRVLERLDGRSTNLWTHEARHLALHAIDVGLPQGVSDARVARALQSTRVPAWRRRGLDPGQAFAHAVSDLVLARLVRGVARDTVPKVLEDPFRDIARPAHDHD